MAVPLSYFGKASVVLLMPGSITSYFYLQVSQEEKETSNPNETLDRRSRKKVVYSTHSTLASDENQKKQKQETG